MHTAELDSAVNHTGMGHAPANGSGEEPTSVTGVPPPRSITHRFATREGTEAYQAQAQSEVLPTCAQPIKQHSSATSLGDFLML